MSIDRYIDEAVRFGSGATDAFGRQRTSDPITLFDSQLQYDDAPLLWQTVMEGTATSAHSPSLACVIMQVDNGSGASVIRQTRTYHRYQPGKSQFVLCTFVFGTARTGNVKRVGYFDKDNGIFLEQNGTALSVVRRTSASGSPQDNAVAQADWNQDVMADLDITKSQIFYVAMEWLGVGSVECGFVIDGAFRPCHLFKNANNIANVYMTTANLPVRYELRNSDATNGATTLQAICCSVISEGGFETQRGYPFSVTNGIAEKGIVTTVKPILSIRPKATFNSITNRGQILLSGINAIASGRSVLVKVLYNPTLQSASYNSVNSSSITEWDQDATSLSGGIEISSFYVPAAASGNPQNPGAPGASTLGLLSRLPLSLDISGTANTVLTIAAASFTATASVSVSLQWQELR